MQQLKIMTIILKYSTNLSDLGSVSPIISDIEVIGDFLSINLQNEVEVVRTLAALSWWEVADNPGCGRILRVLKQEIPVDWILAGN